jgi:hypothetical protein
MTIEIEREDVGIMIAFLTDIGENHEDSLIRTSAREFKRELEEKLENN